MKILCAFLVMAGSAGVSAIVRADDPVIMFDFGTGPAANGYIQVLPTTLYTQQLGYGFETPVKVNAVGHDGRGALEGGFCAGDEPFYFSVKVPEGNSLRHRLFGNGIMWIMAIPCA